MDYLSDGDLAAIALATEEESTVALAARLGRPYFTVAKARQRIQRAGGWRCDLNWTTCAICRGPLARGPRRLTAHAWCRRAQRHPVRKLAAKRKARRTGKDGPAIKRWRTQYPERDRVRRTREVALRRTRNEASRELAEHHREPWDSSEDRYLVEHAYLQAADLAAELGRTIAGVKDRRALLRKRAAAG